MGRVPLRRRRALFSGCVLILSAIAGQPSASSASITWGRAGPFELCLNEALDKWLNTQAELLVNEDPRARALDDAAVAAWTVATLKACGARSGGAVAASEERFSTHMARWRQHIFDLAESIRRKGQSD